MRRDPDTSVPETSRRLRTLIADDEPLARDLLASLVRRDPGLELVAEASSGCDALKALTQYRPQLLLLDIQMPSLDGISVAEQLCGLRDAPYIIFVTAHDAFALNAFRVGVRDYLVKPINRQQFCAAIRRARLALGATPLESDEAIVVKSGDRVASVLPGDIIWVGAANQYAVLHVRSGESFVVSQSLRQFSQRMETYGFLRIHRSTLVNAACITSVQSRAGRYHVRLVDDSEHALARNRKALLGELLTRARDNQ